MAKTIGSFDLASLKNLRDDVTQYFWFESDSSSAWGSGAHVTLYPESQFTDSTSPNYMKGQNIIMNTDGFSIRNGGLPMMVLDNNSLDFNAINTSLGTYTTMATFGLTGATIGQTSGAHIQISSSGFDINLNSSTNIANFGTNGARIGKLSAAHSIIDRDGQRFYARNGITQLANIGYGEGQARNGNSIAPYYTFGTRKETTQEYDPTKTYNIGDLCLYDDGNGYKTYVCQLEIVTPESWNPLRWGIYIGNMSIAGGYDSIASGMYSHTEGRYTINNGFCAHTEGDSTKVFSDDSHAEGYNTLVRGGYAEWCYSHVSGNNTVSNGECRTVIGSYNIDDFQVDRFIGDGVTTTFITTQRIGHDDPIVRIDGQQVSFGVTDGNTIEIFEEEAPQQGSLIEIFYSTTDNIFIIGNGTADNARSNALTVDWAGNVVASGTIKASNSTPSISITTSTGTRVSSTIRRFGNVVQLLMTVQNSSSIAQGGNIYEGTITTTALRPIMTTTGGSYYSTSAITGTISTAGDIVIRNEGGAKSFTSNCNISFTYIVA